MTYGRRVETHSGWDLYEHHLDGRRYSVKPGHELERKLIGAGYWPAPEFESVADAMAWIDADAPFKLPD